MNNYRSLFLLFLIACISFACGEQLKENDNLVISVSILPQKYFVEKIAGNTFDINILIPPGASPATYDPSPRQIKDLSRSDIYFKIGYIGFENKWSETFERENPNLKIVNSSDGIGLLNETEHDGHFHGGIEPHTWMSPKNVKVIAANIHRELVLYDAQNSKVYDANYLSFIKQVDSLDSHIRNKLKDLRTTSFIIYHPALTYYANDYGLNQIAIEFEGKNPSPFYIKQVIEKASQENANVVFVQKQFDMNRAKTLAKEIRGNVIQIDPLDYNWSDQLIEITESLTISKAY